MSNQKSSKKSQENEGFLIRNKVIISAVALVVVIAINVLVSVNASDGVVIDLMPPVEKSLEESIFNLWIGGSAILGVMTGAAYFIANDMLEIKGKKWLYALLMIALVIMNLVIFGINVQIVS